MVRGYGRSRRRILYENRQKKAGNTKKQNKNIKTSQKQIKIKKKKTPIANWNFLEKVLKEHVFRYKVSTKEKIDIKCNDFFVNSGNLYKFLFSKYNAKRHHSMLNSGLNRMLGRKAEQFILDNNKHIKKGFSQFSKDFPFIVASPDGYYGRLKS